MTGNTRAITLDQAVVTRAVGYSGQSGPAPDESAPSSSMEDQFLDEALGRSNGPPPGVPR